MDHYFDQEAMKGWIEEAKKHENTIRNPPKEEGADENKKQKITVTTTDRWPEKHERLIHMADYLFEIDTGFAEMEEYGTVLQTSMSFTYLDWKLA